MGRKAGFDGGRREALRLLAGIPFLPGALAAGCGDKGGRRPVVELPGEGVAGAGGRAAGGAAGTAPAAAAVASGEVPWAGKFPELDLVERLGFAVLRRGGLWIDFGTTDAFKYTLGGWGCGWGRPREQDGLRYAHAVRASSRIFFPWDAPEDLVVRLRVKGIGTGVATPHLNGEKLGTLQLPSDRWEVRTVRVPAQAVRPGDNHLQFVWGGTRDVDGEAVAAGVDWVHVLPAALAEAAESAEPLTQGAVRVPGEPRLALPPGVGLSYSVDVPAGEPVLGLLAAPAAAGASLGGLGAGSRPATLTVRATADGEPTRTLAELEVPSGDPRPVAVDLLPVAGRVVRIDIDAPAGGVVLGGPAVFARPRPADAAAVARIGRVQARNVVLVMIDTLRADHVPPYGSTVVKAPVLQALAERGAMFERFSAVEDWTKPSCATMLTGLYPCTHRAQTDEVRLPSSAKMITELLQALGVRTAAFIANGYVSDKFGFNRGWDSYTNYIREGKPTTANHVFADAASWIERNKDGRFFAYVHTIDPHVPYSPPEQFLRMYDDRPYDGPIAPRRTHLQVEEIKGGRMQVTDRDKERLHALYEGEITFHDGHLGTFLNKLEQLGLAEDTLVVVTSDHGEEFWDHGSVGHGHSIFQELVHVPFFLLWKGVVPAGRRIADNCDHAVVAPTIFDALGMAAPGFFEGRSVLPQALGRQEAGPHGGFSTHQGERMAVWSGRHKYQLTQQMRGGLFDVVDDPGCLADHDEDRPITLRHMRSLLGAFLGASDKRTWRHADLGRANVGEIRSEQAETDAQLEQQLQALGYLRP
jgi:arylsulfatase A-like enzyme